MAEKTYQPVLITSIQAAADLAYVNRFVGVDGNYAGAGAFAVGILNAETDSGKMAPVIAGGIALIEAGEHIHAGKPIVSGATGKAMEAHALTATPPSGATPVTSTGAQAAMDIAGSVTDEVILGYTLDEAAADGSVIRIKLI